MIIGLYRELFLFLWVHLGFFGALVGISVIVSAICFPFYTIIGHLVAKENHLQTVLAPQLAAIKAMYPDPGEHQAAVKRLYARYRYHPLLAVRKVLPLFVALPFLFLTYYMLEGTAQLNGVRFLCFADVGKADGMLFGFNLLPFVMTGINILTMYATPCLTKKDATQAWFIAIFFLVLLYAANTALMIYWCLNQFFNFLRSLYIDNWSGAKVLISQVRRVFSLNWIRNLTEVQYNKISCILLIASFYSLMVFTGRYGESTLTGKMSGNLAPIFACCALLFIKGNKRLFVHECGSRVAA